MIADGFDDPSHLKPNPNICANLRNICAICGHPREAGQTRTAGNLRFDTLR
jgi:hypothetical protein